MLAVFLFKLLGKPDQIGLSGWIVSNCWLAIATSAFKNKKKQEVDVLWRLVFDLSWATVNGTVSYVFLF